MQSELQIETQLDKFKSDFFSALYTDIDQANADLESRIATKELEPFLAEISDKHALFAITIRPDESFLRNIHMFVPQKNFVNRNGSTAFLSNLFSTVIFRIEKYLLNNPSRYPSKRIKNIFRIEFEDKQHQKLSLPHIHGCMAIHPDFENRFEELLVSNAEDNSFFLNLTMTNKKPASTFDQLKAKDSHSYAVLLESIHSFHLSRIHDNAGLIDWVKYMCKEETHSLQLKKSLKDSNQPIIKFMQERLLQNQIQ